MKSSSQIGEDKWLIARNCKTILLEAMQLINLPHIVAHGDQLNKRCNSFVLPPKFIHSSLRWVLWQSTGPFTFAHSFLICIDISQLPFTHGDTLQFVTDVPWHCAHNGLRHLTYIALTRCDCNDPIDFGWHTGSVQSVKVIVLIATVFLKKYFVSILVWTRLIGIDSSKYCMLQ